jgi:hypothetical protein
MAKTAVMSTGRSRVALGPELRLISAAEGVLWLEGTVRLRPGQAVDLVGSWPGGISPARARVVTWQIVRLVPAGPYYRGACRLEL